MPERQTNLTMTAARHAGRGRAFTLIELLAARQRKRLAFTLIELLIVIGILALLVSLVVGVSAYVRGAGKRSETETIQAIIMTAIEAYRDNAMPRNYPPDTHAPYSTSGETLYRFLLGTHTAAPADLSGNPAVRAASEKLVELPSGAARAGWSTFFDGYDNPMRYEVAGGVGGRPVLISAGQDGKWNTAEDNIRSDGRR